MILKYVKVSLFEISYKKNVPFHHIQFVLYVPVYFTAVGIRGGMLKLISCISESAQQLDRVLNCGSRGLMVENRTHN